MPLDSDLGWRERRRRKIVSAASLLFGQATFDSVQMDDIAREAGISKPTLYRYFGSKDELVLEVLNDGLSELGARMAAILARDTTPHQALQELIQEMIDTLGHQIASLRLLTDHRAGLADRWRLLFRRQRHPLVLALRTVLERGIARGDFGPIDLEVVPSLIVGMIRGGLMGVQDVPRERVAATAIRFITGAVMPAATATAAEPGTPCAGTPFSPG